MTSYRKKDSAVLAVDIDIEYAYTESMFLEAFRRLIVSDFKVMGIDFKYEFINSEVTFNMRNMRLPSSIIKKNKPILALQVSEIEDPYRMFSTGPYGRDSVLYGNNVQDFSEKFLIHHERSEGVNMGVSISMKRMGFNIEPTTIFSTRPDKSNARRKWEYERSINIPYQVDIVMQVIVSEKVKSVWKKVHGLADDISLEELANDMAKHSFHKLNILRNDGTGKMEIVVHMKVPTIMKFGESDESTRDRGNLDPGWSLRRSIEASFPIPTAFVFHTLTPEMEQESIDLESRDTAETMVVDNSVVAGSPSFTVGDMTKIWDVSYQSDDDNESPTGVLVELSEAFRESCINNESMYYEYWKHLVDVSETDMLKIIPIKNGEPVDSDVLVDITNMNMTHMNVKHDDSFTVELYTDLEHYNKWLSDKGEGYTVDTGSSKDIMYPNK